MPKNDKNKAQDPRIAAQNRAIKQRLSKYYRSLSDAVRPSIYQLHKALSLDQNGNPLPNGFEVSYNTVRDVLSEDPTDSVPNLHVVLGLCRLWNLDYATILAPSDSDVVAVPSLTSQSSVMEVLNDDDYSGTFFVYMYSCGINSNFIEEYQLTIDNHQEAQQAMLTCLSARKDLNGKLNSLNKVYHGVPILFSKEASVMLLLTRQEGDFYVLFFNYKKYGGDENKLYYRRGLAVTTDTDSGKPLACNFVLFQNRLSKAKFDRYVPGLLRGTSEDFIISKRAIEKLRSTDPEMGRFFDDYGFNWEKREELMARINIPHIISSLDDKGDSQERNRVITALTQMQAQSYAPVRVHYSNPFGYPSLARKVIQQNTEKDPQK